MTAAELIRALGIGLLAGLHTSIWGMYKDAPHEGFTWGKFRRSALFGAAIGPLAAWFFSLTPTSAGLAVVLFGVTYGLERGVAESYKTFFRDQDQSKYTIPMQLAVFGTPVESRAVRRLLGVGYVAVMVLGLLGVDTLQARIGGGPRWLVALTIGALGGWFSAFGGAWKDAPIEGFHVLKFFRSPLMAAAYAWVILHFTDRWAVAVLAAIGYTVATTETYKTFFFPSKPRGKFAGKPVLFPALVTRRHWAVPVYVAIWLLVIGTCWVALA